MREDVKLCLYAHLRVKYKAFHISKCKSKNTWHSPKALPYIVIHISFINLKHTQLTQLSYVCMLSLGLSVITYEMKISPVCTVIF